MAIIVAYQLGPKAETMRALGNKVAARDMAVAAGVPVMPATPPLPEDMDEVCRLAQVHYQQKFKAALKDKVIHVVASNLSEQDSEILQALCSQPLKNDGKSTFDKSAETVAMASLTLICLLLLLQ